MSEKRATVQSFHEVIQSVIIGVVGQIGSYTEPPVQVIAGVFAFSLNAARKIEDGNHADKLGSLLSRRTGEAGGLAVILHLYILHRSGLGGPWIFLIFAGKLRREIRHRSSRERILPVGGPCGP